MKRIIYTNSKDDTPMTVCYGRSFSDSVVDIKLVTTVRLTRKKANKTGSNGNVDIHAVLARIQRSEPKGKLPAEEIADLRSIFKYMFEVDVQYYGTILHDD